MSFKPVVVAALAAVFISSARVSAIPAPAADSAQAFSGDATYYYADGRLGACGTPIQNTDLVAALSADQYASGSNCRRRINVNYQGRSVNVAVADLCPGCASGSIDLTPAGFQQLASLDAGRIQVTWDFA